MVRYDYEARIQHDGLNAFKIIRAPDQYSLNQKVRAQQAQWAEQWAKKSATRAKADRVASKKDAAVEQTNEAREAIDELETMLKRAVAQRTRVDWDALKDSSRFPEQRPTISLPQKPVGTPLPPAPNGNDPRFQPKFGLLDHLSSARKSAKISEAQTAFAGATRAWETECARIRERDLAAVASHQKTVDAAQKEFDSRLAAWERRRADFEKEQAVQNSAIDQRREAYEKLRPAGVIDFCEIILAAPEYPERFPHEYQVDYVAETRILVVDYSLPAPEQLPSLKEVKYVQARDELLEVPLAEAAQAKLYDSTLYQIALRSISDLLRADTAGALQSVVFNGWVNAVDRTKGKRVNACVMSLQVKADEFLEVNLPEVDPKACFKALKGVGSSKLSGLAPIAPILQLNKEDKRFVSAYDVEGELSTGYNLASMDWEDFEQLIRELFEEEFKKAGGEVKITRASRDGGVDAVVFDPDPIRGGKIVIQAKRYTNTVDVSAVRDLYGTVMNEGANKGILVTTADYGPDAYAFAKDKPLTLMNGGNLLHLLAKHGHEARIDLKEAKLVQSEKKREAGATSGSPSLK